jgi:hypothetical protein
VDVNSGIAPGKDGVDSSALNMANVFESLPGVPMCTRAEAEPPNAKRQAIAFPAIKHSPVDPHFGQGAFIRCHLLIEAPVT